MLPLALATFAAAFILHVRFVFIPVNVVIDVSISVYIYVYVTATPVGMPPSISPCSARSEAHPKANKRTGGRQEKRWKGRKKRPPPSTVNHGRVVTRDIDDLRVCRLNDNRLLFHNDLLLFRGF
jgi:hypothetical protein